MAPRLLRFGFSLLTLSILLTDLLIQTLEVEVNKGLVGKALRGDAKLLGPYIESLDEDGKLGLKTQLESGEANITVDGKNLKLTHDMITVKKVYAKGTGERLEN